MLTPPGTGAGVVRGGTVFFQLKKEGYDEETILVRIVDGSCFWRVGAFGPGHTVCRGAE